MSAEQAPQDDQPEAQWADLADLVLIIAREIQFRGYSDPQAIPLTQSEGMVMRYLLAHPDAVPSRIADAVGLQRTNLSTTLRGLERKGLIERQVSPDDRRGVTVRPTSRGKGNYALVRHEWADAVAQAAGHDTKLAVAGPRRSARWRAGHRPRAGTGRRRAPGCRRRS